MKSKTNGYASLAAAIIRSGEMANDTHFLNSDWCANLRELVKLASDMNRNDGTNNAAYQSTGPKTERD